MSILVLLLLAHEPSQAQPGERANANYHTEIVHLLESPPVETDRP